MTNILKPRYKKYKRDNNFWSRKRRIRPTWHPINLWIWNNLEWKKSKNKVARARENHWRRKFKTKQEIKSYYGNISESTFQKINRKNRWSPQLLTSQLELRLDTIVYRCHWAKSQFHAQQSISQGDFMVNGYRARTPSLMIKPGDCVQVTRLKESIFRVKKVFKWKMATIKKYARATYLNPRHYRGGLPSLRKKFAYWVVIPNNLELDYYQMALRIIEITPQEKFHWHFPLSPMKFWKIS